MTLKYPLQLKNFNAIIALVNDSRFPFTYILSSVESFFEGL